MISETQQILKIINELKSVIKIIKEMIPDKEMFLTIEEEILLEESYAHEKEGILISSKDLRKKLGI